MVALRSLVMVMPETNTSASPLLNAGNRLSHGWSLYSTLKLPASPMALIRSISKPVTFLFSSSDSNGANVALPATRSTLPLPSAAPDAAAGAGWDALWLAGALLCPPQAASDRVRHEKAADSHVFVVIWLSIPVRVDGGKITGGFYLMFGAQCKRFLSFVSILPHGLTFAAACCVAKVLRGHKAA